MEDGHVANIFIQSISKKYIIDAAIDALNSYNPLEKYYLPSSPEQVINYLGNDIYPTPKEHVNNQGGMEFTCGALKFNEKSGVLQITGMIHNLIRGAAGGALLTAELMIKLGYITKKV